MYLCAEGIFTTQKSRKKTSSVRRQSRCNTGKPGFVAAARNSPVRGETPNILHPTAMYEGCEVPSTVEWASEPEVIV